MKPALILLLFSLLPVVAEGQSLPEHPAVATVRFECYWEAATPQDFVITVKSTGEARYLSRNPLTATKDAQDPDYFQEFTLSPASQTKIFKLAEQANFFNGDFDYKKHKLANTGAKTLIFADPRRHFETTYNWSENSAIDQLTQLFEAISNTVEHGRKLQYLRRFDKLGLEDELKAMEDMAHHDYLAEIQVIAPILTSIANDSAVMNIARQRARRLLTRAEKENGENARVKVPQ